MNVTRRGFLKGALGLAGAGMTGALTVPALKSLLPPPVTRCNEDDAHATLTYKSESGKWYESKGGETAKASDFKSDTIFFTFLRSLLSNATIIFLDFINSFRIYYTM